MVADSIQEVREKALIGLTWASKFGKPSFDYKKVEPSSITDTHRRELFTRLRFVKHVAELTNEDRGECADYWRAWSSFPSQAKEFVVPLFS